MTGRTRAPRGPLLARGSLALALAALPTAIGSAAELHVPSVHPTIQGAIDAASPGDVVVVSPGTYLENIRFHGKLITVRGAGIDLTTIDGSAATQGPACRSTVLFIDGEDPLSILEDLTITGGEGCATPQLGGGSQLRGGGILGWGAHPTIRRVRIAGNEAINYGGGAYFRAIPGPLAIRECRFEGNTANTGGGLAVTGPGNLLIEDSEFTGNIANLDGGGIAAIPGSIIVRRSRFAGNACGLLSFALGGAVLLAPIDPGLGTAAVSALFEDCTISGNSSSFAGGGFVALATPTTFRRCTFEENFAPGYSVAAPDFADLLFERCVFRGNLSPQGVTLGTSVNDGSIILDHCTFHGEEGPGIRTHDNPLLVTHCIAWGNSGALLAPDTVNATVEWSDIEGGFPGTGNIDADPLFVDADAGLFQLLAGSPCIDAGSPAYAADEDGSVSDLGAFPYVDPAFLRGDANGDGGLDIADGVAILLALFAGTFELRCDDAADANDDGAVDTADAVAVFQRMLLGGAPLPAPSACGEDPTDDVLGCDLAPACA